MIRSVHNCIMPIYMRYISKILLVLRPSMILELVIYSVIYACWLVMIVVKHALVKLITSIYAESSDCNVIIRRLASAICNLLVIPLSLLWLAQNQQYFWIV